MHFTNGLAAIAIAAATVSATPLIRRGVTDPALIDAAMFHNDYRYFTNSTGTVPALTWNQAAADIGQAWTDKCDFTAASTAPGTYGQNKFWSTGAGSLSNAILDAVNSWILPYRTYNNPYPTGEPSAALKGSTWTYTLVVWKSTTNVGCGVTHCPTAKTDSSGGMTSDVYIVNCLYTVKGNVAGQYSANVLPWVQ